MSAPALEARGVEKSYCAAAAAAPVLAGVDLEVAEGEKIALIGPSGCGKSTFLNICAGLIAADRGAVRIGRPDAFSYVFQEPRLLPWRTVEDNILLSLPPGAASRAAARAGIEAVGLADARSQMAAKLSLGMARRCALARAFAQEPRLLLLDEPFVSLDAANALRLRRLLVELLERRAAAAILVTHDLREAIALADRILVMSPAPARIALEARVDLSARERADESAVDRFRAAFTAEHRFDGADLALPSERASPANVEERP